MSSHRTPQKLANHASKTKYIHTRIHHVTDFQQAQIPISRPRSVQIYFQAWDKNSWGFMVELFAIIGIHAT
jgi:hypothetical protein